MLSEATGMWYFPPIRGPRYRPQNAMVLLVGTPKRYLMLRNTIVELLPRPGRVKVTVSGDLAPLGVEIDEEGSCMTSVLTDEIS